MKSSLSYLARLVVLASCAVVFSLTLAHTQETKPGVINQSEQIMAGKKAETKATPAPPVDPLAFTEAEQRHITLIIGQQRQIGQKIRTIEDEFLRLADDDKNGFAYQGLLLKNQATARKNSEDEGQAFIDRVKPRCPGGPENCIFDFDKMRLVPKSVTKVEQGAK